MRLLSSAVGAGVPAGLVGAVLSGAPSTVVSLARGDDLLVPVRAVAALVPGGRRAPVAAGVIAHVAISAWWGVVLAATLPRRRPVLEGLAAGAAIAAVDLGVVGRRVRPIDRLPQGRQWLDHLAYGVVVSVCLSRRPRRARRATG
jgi:hypothetical protein